MDRYYQCFTTKDERTAWEREQKRKDPRFKVCFREPIKALAKDVYLSEEVKEKFKYATIYTYKQIA